MTKEKKIIIGIISILTIIIVILSYFLINKNAMIKKQAEKIELQAMETNGSNSYVTTQEHLNELSQSTKVYYLGTGNSFNVQALTGLDESILSKLTVNNFIVEILNLSSTKTSIFYGQPGGLVWWALASGTTISKGYNTNSFTLTLSGLNQTITCHRDGNSDWPSQDYNATQSINYKVYLVVGDIKNV